MVYLALRVCAVPAAGPAAARACPGPAARGAFGCIRHVHLPSSAIHWDLSHRQMFWTSRPFPRIMVPTMLFDLLTAVALDFDVGRGVSRGKVLDEQHRFAYQSQIAYHHRSPLCAGAASLHHFTSNNSMTVGVVA